jgi:hypothetical protein
VGLRIRMTIRHCVGIPASAARKGPGHRAGDVHHLEMDVTAAAQDGERHPLDGAPPLVCASCSGARRTRPCERMQDEAAEGTNFVKSLLKFVVKWVNSMIALPSSEPLQARARWVLDRRFVPSPRSERASAAQ